MSEPETAAVENALSRAGCLCDQWQVLGLPLPPDARDSLLRLVRLVVLDAGRVCELRGDAEARPMMARSEARKCADAVRHHLLCGPGETVCLRCDGGGCESCRGAGVVPRTLSLPLQSK